VQHHERLTVTVHVEEDFDAIDLRSRQAEPLGGTIRRRAFWRQSEGAR
jgi:hypothetical protein